MKLVKLLTLCAALACAATLATGCACCKGSAKKSACGMACCAEGKTDCATCPTCTPKK